MKSQPLDSKMRLAFLYQKKIGSGSDQQNKGGYLEIAFANLLDLRLRLDYLYNICLFLEKRIF